ncbi:response regulator [Paraburkholderia sp. J8-2]|uniref:response regulator n=1 Tax=Paraburkholderia sp. J8-2 TaxID=2805440 RepID=UPI002AB7B3E0|nr:response regulator [Paraburkholderia sp. J8-2]
MTIEAEKNPARATARERKLRGMGRPLDSLGPPRRDRKEDHEEQRPSHRNRLGRSRKKRMATVLLVDDDINALDALKELVGQEGYRVRTAADGSDALQSALDDPPDVVISDCMMPRMDGLSLMREMRRSSKLARVPLVLVSALVTPPPDADVAGFLRKPFAVAQLLDILHRVATP